jgi:hypothetical protein
MSQTSNSAAAVQLAKSTAPTTPAAQRPFRLKLRGSILALIRLPNQREVRGKLHQLSVTGGLVHLKTPLDEKLKVELIYQMGENTIREQAEILFPMWATQGWLQPFRFIDLPEASKKALESNLLSLVKQMPQPAPQAVKDSTPPPSETLPAS